MNSRGTLLLNLLLLACSAQALQAAEIRLKDQTTLDGDVVQVDDDAVFLRVPRSSIQTVGGKPLPRALVEGAEAPAFSVHDILGQPRAVGANTGKLTLLHFWVHWCPHCRSDAPKIQALYDRFRDNAKVQVLTVNLDDKRDVLDRFIKERQATYPIIAAAEQAAQPHGVDLPELYQITGFPVTYLIDAQGVIRHKMRGSFSEAGIDVGALVEQLLASPTPSS